MDADGVLRLMRSYCDEFVNAQNASVCKDLMIEDYEVHIAGTHTQGRATVYEPMVAVLFETFPDLTLTLHELIGHEDRFATRFTLRGSSTRRSGRPALWGGVAIYSWDGERLTEVWVEEDHHLARAQLRDGAPPPDYPFVPSASGAWRTAFGFPDPSVSDAALAWLEAREPEATIDALLVVGRRFAFHLSAPGVHEAGMGTVGPDGSVHDLSAFTDGGRTDR